MLEQGWLRVDQAAEYAGNVSPRTVRDWIKNKGLKCARVGGIILIKREWLDDFLEKFAEVNGKVDRIVEEVVGGVEK